MTRSSFAAVLVLAMSACKPDLPHTDATPVAYAVFDPTTSQIPLPNDLAFLNDPNTTCVPAAAAGAPACAQAELLTTFGGSFPSDQEVAITIDFVENSFDAKGVAIPSAPDLDLTSFNATTFAVLGTTASGSGPVPIDALTDADYVKAADGSKGTLTIHHQGHTPWPTGQYAAFVRGGDNGIKTKDGVPISASPTFYLIAQGKDLTKPENLGLLKAQLGTAAAAAAAGEQLNQLVQIYSLSLFPTVDALFPHQELAIATTFKIGVTQTNVTIDPARGLAPLPFDLLRDATGHISWLAACSFAGSTLGADGKSCAAAAATGLASGFVTLDGFSTTGAILGPTSDLIQANTVTATTLMLYDLSNPASPVQVDPDSLIIEPCEFTSAKTATGCTAGASLAPVIAFQPAGASFAQANPSANPLPGNFRSKPLKDDTDYAVVMTTGILDKASNPLAAGTVAKILKFTNPLYANNKSQISSIDDLTAAGLEKMRLQLGPVFTKLGTGGVTKDKVAIAYTFHTQTVLEPALKLAALPYTLDASTALPGDVTPVDTTVDAAYADFGATAAPHDEIDEVLKTTITTFNLLDPTTGAFNPDATKAVPETLNVLIITPKLAAITKTCAGSALKCAPLMVFRHGLTRSRADVLSIANTYAAKGMITVAIDAAKHGDRSWCSVGATQTGCLPGVACDPIAGAATQGDANPPGTCHSGGLIKLGLNGTPAGTGGVTDGIAAASGNYLIGANFFRTRDTLRQDLIDESQLIRALAYVPAANPANKLFLRTSAKGYIADPQVIYYTGQSLGAIQGAANVATNPRISKAVLNVGGGTLVDVFTNSPSFSAQVAALLTGLGIDPATNPSKYLQFLTVAKTVLDPADPVNFASHLIKAPLPDLLTDPTGATPQAAKSILSQIADCDTTVPNPFNVVLSTNIGVGGGLPDVLRSPAAPNFFSGTSTGVFQLFTADASITTLPGFLTQVCTGSSPSSAKVSHGFLLDFTKLALMQLAQTDAANFVTANTNPPSVEHP